MEKLTATGKARAIGVCNYSVKYLQELLRHATIMPAVNQIENHPYLPQADVVWFCKARGTTSWIPLDQGAACPIYRRQAWHTPSDGPDLLSRYVSHLWYFVPR